MDRVTKFEELVRKDVEHFQESVGLKSGADIQMVLLKGHLLIEELLEKFIESKLPDPKHLAEGRFTFHQRLVLAQALHARPDLFGYGWVWGAARTLNTLRNQMVHQMAPEGFDRKMEEFMSTVERQLPFPLAGGEKHPEYRMAKLGMMVSVVNLCLSRLLRAQSMTA
jgi:hypothetical protein